MFKKGYFLVFFFMSLSLISANAQSDRGTITGTIQDPNGALLPNAIVIAINAGSQTEYKTQTTDTGNYTLASIPAGAYSLRVEAAGFRVYLQSGITVQVAQTARVDVSMQVGGASETDQVTDGA